jgi:AcrR family transcriptional regulator
MSPKEQRQAGYMTAVTARIGATGKQRPTRAEKAGRTRQALLQAAAETVGEEGFGGLSVASITRRANVALGTFYLHFETKQALMDALLPWLGEEVRSFLNKLVAKATHYAEYEIMNFEGLMTFQRHHPYFVRILSESEVMTPEAYQDHIRRSIARYHEAVSAAHMRGELPSYREDQLEVLATMLVSVKLLMFVRYAGGKPKEIAHMRTAYLTFVFQALFADRAAEHLLRI